MTRRRPVARSRLSIRVAISAAAFVASGCESLVYNDWDAKPVLPPLPARYVQVSGAELARKCGSYPGGIVLGCADRNFVTRVCTIYTKSDPPKWLLDHERKHCAGYDHSRPRTIENREEVAPILGARAHSRSCRITYRARV